MNCIIITFVLADALNEFNIQIYKVLVKFFFRIEISKRLKSRHKCLQRYRYQPILKFYNRYFGFKRGKYVRPKPDDQIN